MRLFRLCLIFAAAALTAAAQPAPTPASPAPLNMQEFQQQAVSIFNPSFITNPGSALNTACDRLLLIFQGISVVIIVAGMIGKIRKEQEQLEGVGTMILKVAFIATIPFWRSFALQSADAVSDAVGYQTLSFSHPLQGTNVMGRMWDMVGQWMPPGSPQTDTLEAQTQPANGDEQNWLSRGWNWAKGFASSTVNAFENFWQAITGGLRSLFILICMVVVVVCSIITIILMYFGELIRYFMFYVGCAMLPIFIAGLGIELLKQQSVKYILGLVSIACWPVGWAIANIGIVVMVDGVTTWMTKMTTAAAGAALGGLVAPPIAVAAPFLAWGVIFLFVGLTLAILVWSLVSLVFAPIAITKVVTSGAQMMGGIIGTSIAGTAAAGAVAAGAAATVVSGGTAAPAVAGLGAGVGKMAAGAAGAFSKFSHGAAALAGKVGGARVGSAATSLANRMSSAASAAAGGVSHVASGSAGAMGGALSGGSGALIGGALKGASRVMSMAARMNPQREHDAGAFLGEMLAESATGRAGAARYKPRYTPNGNQSSGPAKKRTAPWLPPKST